MGQQVAFAFGVLVSAGVSLALVAWRWRRSGAPVAASQHLPPPVGHRAVLAATSRTMTCPCGWCYAVAWPATAQRVNRARLAHYSAVEQQRLAERLGVDAASMLDQIVAAAGPRARPALLPVPSVTAPALEPGATSEWPRRTAASRTTPRALQARRAAAIVTVEAARVLPRYTGDEE